MHADKGYSGLPEGGNVGSFAVPADQLRTIVGAVRVPCQPKYSNGLALGSYFHLSRGVLQPLDDNARSGEASCRGCLHQKGRGRTSSVRRPSHIAMLPEPSGQRYFLVSLRSSCCRDGRLRLLGLACPQIAQSENKATGRLPTVEGFPS